MKFLSHRRSLSNGESRRIMTTSDHNQEPHATSSPSSWKSLSCVLPVSPAASLSSCSTAAASFAVSSHRLDRAVATEQWDWVERYCYEHAAQASQWKRRAGNLFDDGSRLQAQTLPLHEALVTMGDGDAPLSDVHFRAIRALVKAYPPALLQSESSYDRLPLHCACRKLAPFSHDQPDDPSQNTAWQIIAWLADQEPQAALIPDALRRLPLHYALSNGASLAVIRLLLAVAPESARGVDVHGFTPLHVACATARPRRGEALAIVTALLRLHPAAAWATSTSGFTVVQCLRQPSSPRHASSLGGSCSDEGWVSTPSTSFEDGNTIVSAVMSNDDDDKENERQAILKALFQTRRRHARNDDWPQQQWAMTSPALPPSTTASKPKQSSLNDHMDHAVLA